MDETKTMVEKAEGGADKVEGTLAKLNAKLADLLKQASSVTSSSFEEARALDWMRGAELREQAAEREARSAELREQEAASYLKRTADELRQRDVESVIAHRKAVEEIAERNAAALESIAASLVTLVGER
jgi:hypothetical protein